MLTSMAKLRLLFAQKNIKIHKQKPNKKQASCEHPYGKRSTPCEHDVKNKCYYYAEVCILCDLTLNTWWEDE
jgi:hypothetical protein